MKHRRIKNAWDLLFSFIHINFNRQTIHHSDHYFDLLNLVLTDGRGVRRTDGKLEVLYCETPVTIRVKYLRHLVIY